MLNLETRQIFVSKDIVFDEENFPFLTLPPEDVQVKSTSYDAMSYTVSPIQVVTHSTSDNSPQMHTSSSDTILASNHDVHHPDISTSSNYSLDSVVDIPFST